MVNRIAAGEVIERPASVVKELVENAIDAGATSVIVEVEDGGLGLIRVVDDGCGIPPDQLPLALAEHATSKLVDDDDLFRIGTKGFRGEAIASIASVSHLRILSRTPGSEGAWQIESRGGEHSDVQASAGNIGTTVEVRNLFFNTPARRKFMKGPGTEFGHISDMVLKLALPHPAVEFIVSHNGRTSLRLPRSGADSRMLEAWPEDFRERRLRLDAADAEVRLQGIIGLPELAHPTPRHQYLYVNGRPVRDKFISHALKESFRGLTEPGRHPAAVLLITLPPEDVDVNVHPTKIEVRFRNANRIHGLVMACVREVLLGADLTPRASAKPVASDIEPVKPREDLMQTLADFFRMQPPVPTLLDTLPPPQASAPRSVSPPSPVTHETPSPAAVQPADPARETPSRSEPPVVPVAGPIPALQLHNTYLVVETPEGMQIIDQHALHERILFEELLARVTRGPLESQRLLMPHILRASDRQIELLEQIRPLLEKLGLEVMVAGPGQIGILGFPSFLSRLDPAEFVRDLLDKSEQELLDLSQEHLLHNVLDMMACKAAVKAGDPLTPQQIDGLLSRRHLIERSSNCPHGRPTTLKLSLRDLERQFKRTGF